MLNPLDQFKGWLPVAVVAVTLVGSFYMVRSDITALEVRASSHEQRADLVQDQLSAIEDKLDEVLVGNAVLQTDIQYIKAALDSTVYGRFQGPQ